MSSYLNIYLKDKETKKNRLLCSFSRVSALYQAFNENLSITSDDDGEQYTTLSLVAFDEVLSSLQADQERLIRHLFELEKYAKDNVELIDEILSDKECLERTFTVIGAMQLLRDILEDCDSECSSFIAMYANID